MIKRIGCLWLLSSVLFAETVVVKPNRYYETFAAHEPVARIRPGDSVVTKLLDSRGRDETGKLILDGDNVLTGPFYIEGAEPGDTLIIRLDRVRLNRDWGWNGVRISTDALAPSRIEGLESAICCEEWLQPKRRNALKWVLEPSGGMMRPSQPLGNKVKLEFPAHPSVGCVGVAPPLKQAISSVQWGLMEETWITTGWMKAPWCTCPFTNPGRTSSWAMATPVSAMGN